MIALATDSSQIGHSRTAVGKTESSRRDQDSRCNRIKSIDVIKSIDARQERKKTYRLQCRRSLVARVALGRLFARGRATGNIWVVRLFSHGWGESRGVDEGLLFVQVVDVGRSNLRQVSPRTQSPRFSNE